MDWETACSISALGDFALDHRQGDAVDKQHIIGLSLALGQGFRWGKIQITEVYEQLQGRDLGEVFFVNFKTVHHALLLPTAPPRRRWNTAWQSNPPGAGLPATKPADPVA